MQFLTGCEWFSETVATISQTKAFRGANPIVILSPHWYHRRFRARVQSWSWTFRKGKLSSFQEPQRAGRRTETL